MTLNMEYFEKLRDMINRKLLELVKDNKYDKYLAKDQIEKYSWLYGALGKVPSDVMFICENPSVTGIENAHIETIDGGRPDIEAQWWGGPNDNAACCFRVALYRLRLKTTRIRERNGWECYITNVIKQSNKAADQEKLKPIIKNQQARDWAQILQWEVDQVSPKYVFCVGDNAYHFVNLLQREDLLAQFPVYKIMHYSAHYKSKDAIIDAIVSGVQDAIKTN